MNAPKRLELTAARLGLIDIEQGSPEWLALRKTKITATDASIIMGANHWKTKTQLYHEKLSNDPPPEPNERMKRGSALEPVAREWLSLQSGLRLRPAVVVKDWAMASLDAMTMDGNIIEIKCPGEKDHAMALSGKVPEHYYPQLQHQMYVCDVPGMTYLSFDGIDGHCIAVSRNEEYIEKMLIEERKFYDCLMNKTPPEVSEDDYTFREDQIWEDAVAEWKTAVESMKIIEQHELEARKRLIFLSGETNTRGCGISLCQVQRKGNVDYSAIPQLKGIDLETYRKPSSISWRITCA